MSTEPIERPTMTDALGPVHGPALAVQAFVTLVRQSPDMHFELLEGHPEVVEQLKDVAPEQLKAGVDALKNINAHLATARTHADTWTGSLLPMMFEVNRDIEGFGRQYLAVADDLLGRLGQLTSESSHQDYVDVLTRVERELNALVGALGRRRDAAASVASALADFAGAVARDAGAFTGDRTAVDALVTGESGALATLRDEVTAVNKAISNDTAMIGGGAAAIVTGVALAVAGGILIATGAGAGAGVALIVGGVVVAGGGIALTTVGGIDLPKQQARLADLTREISLLEASVHYFTNAEQIVQFLAGSAAQAADGVAKLDAVWASEQAALAEVIKDVRDTLATTEGAPEDVAPVVEVFLGPARDEWASVQKDADQLRDYLEGVRDNVDTTLLAQAA